MAASNKWSLLIVVKFGASKYTSKYIYCSKDMFNKEEHVCVILSYLFKLRFGLQFKKGPKFLFGK